MHYIHLGRFGLVLNIRYTEMLDFLLGWTTFDLAGDDGTKFGDWPWRTRAKRIGRERITVLDCADDR